MHAGFLALAFVAVVATTLGGCALKAPPSASELRRDALPHTIVPAAWKGGGASLPIARVLREEAA